MLKSVPPPLDFEVGFEDEAVAELPEDERIDARGEG
jgi:hypothetical protein